MEKNEIYTATCTGYAEDGTGVVRINGAVIFVPNLLEGEEAEIGITKMKKTYGYGRVAKLLKPSEHRVEPKCSVSRPCGGCQLQHMDDTEQRKFKEDKVRQCFRRNAGMEVDVKPITKAEPFWNYRNKVQIPVQVSNGKVQLGFYQNHTNKVIPYDECHVQTKLSNELTVFFREQLEKLGCAEVFRHILIKHAHVSNEIMVCLVVKKYPFKNCETLTKNITEQFPDITSLSVMVNKRDDNVILDGEEIHLAGKEYIEEELLGNRFKISAKSFFQINPYATKLLYARAIELAELTKDKTLIDLYCGTGTMGIIASSQAKQVYGIEIVEDAIKDAKYNAERNDVHNIEFMCADALQGAKRLIESDIHADAMIIDPPRKGCTKDTLDAIVQIAPKRLVYVSCDPATLARDVKILSENGYRLETVEPFDLFPQTVHVETVCLLSKLNTKQHIEIEVDMDELDLTSAESKATYEEIKDWVKENYGFNVSTLNIAKTKEKCSILERECYNKPKNENSRQPNVPKEKENAIIEAFKHFQMISE